MQVLTKSLLGPTVYHLSGLVWARPAMACKCAHRTLHHLVFPLCDWVLNDNILQVLSVIQGSPASQLMGVGETGQRAPLIESGDIIVKVILPRCGLMAPNNSDCRSTLSSSPCRLQTLPLLVVPSPFRFASAVAAPYLQSLSEVPPVYLASLRLIYTISHRCMSSDKFFADVSLSSGII